MILRRGNPRPRAYGYKLTKRCYFLNNKLSHKSTEASFLEVVKYE